MSERVEDTHVSLEIEWQWAEIHRHDEELPFSGQILCVPKGTNWILSFVFFKAPILVTNLGNHLLWGPLDWYQERCPGSSLVIRYIHTGL